MINKRDFFENYQPLQNFQTMNPTDREKYLKLYSRYTMEDLHKKLAMDGSDPTISDLILKLYGIYETNKFKGGVGIQAARLECNLIYLVCDIKQGGLQKNGGNTRFWFFRLRGQLLTLIMLQKLNQSL